MNPSTASTNAKKIQKMALVKMSGFDLSKLKKEIIQSVHGMPARAEMMRVDYWFASTKYLLLLILLHRPHFFL